LIALAAALVVTFSPNPSHFGQLVTATVQGGGTPSFKPFTVRERHGNTYVLQCLDPACVPGAGGRTIQVGGSKVVILPRASAKQVQTPLRSFRRQTELPKATYRVAPSLLRALLLAGAAALGLLAVVLSWPFLRRLVPERRDERTPLERALDRVRESLRREQADRRRALDLLARALGRDRSAREALELAWSQPEPDSRRIEQLVDAVTPVAAREGGE
jgi:hypothetical protein